jgi:hypothetical protein
MVGIGGRSLHFDMRALPLSYLHFKVIGIEIMSSMRWLLLF